MKSISTIWTAIIVLLSFTSCGVKIENAKTENVKIYGNCEMCKETIETAGNVKKTAQVDWNQNTKIATLKYDTTKTNQNSILKRIALAGYDNDVFLAPDDAYSKLSNCCQYHREKKTMVKVEEPISTMDNMNGTDPLEDTNPVVSETVEIEQLNQLTSIFDDYFELKDALVQTNGTSASEKSKALLAAINTVKMDKLPMDVHMVWMKVVADLTQDATRISQAKDITKQRDHFIRLSKNIYSLMKVSKYEETVYYQFCPMANDGKGANWLSKENTVKNPYYGSQMLSCGKTVETIK